MESIAAKIYYSDTVVMTENVYNVPPAKPGKKKKIEFFSDRSKRSLLFLCRNSGYHIKSQLCLTYHLVSPNSGKELKKQLNTFLVSLRKFRPGIKYIWVLEFQERGVPHLHFFTDVPADDKEFREYAAVRWNKIIDGGPMNLEFQRHPRNFIPWNMESGKYLAKQYLAKADQKCVPESFHDVGRFWGASRNLKPDFIYIIPGETISEPVYKKAVRHCCKFKENFIKNWIKINYRLRKRTVNLTSTSHIFIKLLEFFHNTWSNDNDDQNGNGRPAGLLLPGASNPIRGECCGT
jgi:hypothetical protein